CLYLCLVGLVAAFQGRNIVTGYIGLGTGMLGLTALIAGYRAGLPFRGPRGDDTSLRPAQALLSVAVSGATGAAPVGDLVLLIDAVNLQAMLISASRALADLLTFTGERFSSALAITGVSALLGLLGAGLNLIPQAIRRPLVLALVTV